MRMPFRLAAIVLPIAGLAAMWGWTDIRSRQGTDWLVPIAGYDPRDLLRGHYIQFRYDWPAGDDMPEFALYEFCLQGAPPTIDRIVPTGEGRACEYRAEARGINAYSADGLRQGRLYVPQTRAAGLEEKLFDPELQAMVLIRLREDGLVTPRELRFRPLTAADRARRDADVGNDDGDGDGDSAPSNNDGNEIQAAE